MKKVGVLSMKAMITFDCHLQIDIDDTSRDRKAPTLQQLQQFKDLVMQGFDCERVEITGYQVILIPYI